MFDGSMGSLGSVVMLGAFHGVNPAMGWLFAVSLGLQSQSGRAVWRALGPLALGHALAVVAAVGVAMAAGRVLPLSIVRWGAATALLAFGIFHFARHSHPGWSRAGMTVGARDLTIWSFIVSSAHGAGLMVLPFVLASPGAEHAHHGSATGVAGTAGLVVALAHTVSYLLVAGAIAWLVYSQLGLRLLRKAWINVNALWATALIATAIATVA
ncbi:MAG: hypothetical protein ACREOK_06045 [Gemmatimonadaceae bacterium]